MIATSSFDKLLVALPHLVEGYPVFFLWERAGLPGVHLVLVLALHATIMVFRRLVAPASVLKSCCVIDLDFQPMIVIVMSGYIHDAHGNDHSDNGSSGDNGKDSLAEAPVVSTHSCTGQR